MRDRDEAARRQVGCQRGDDPRRVVGVGHEMQDRQKQDGDGLGEVQRPGRLPQDVFGVVQIGLKVVAGTLVGAGEQRTGVRQDERVVIDVHNPGPRIDPLGDLMSAVGCGEPGADVDELVNAVALAHVAHRAGEEAAVADGGGDHLRPPLDHPGGDVAVGRVVVFTADPDVVHTRWVRDGGIEDPPCAGHWHLRWYMTRRDLTVQRGIPARRASAPGWRSPQLMTRYYS